MVPDYIFSFKPHNNCVGLMLEVVGMDSKSTLLNTTMNLEQALKLQVILGKAIEKAEEIHAIIENADAAPPMTVII